MSKIHLTLPPNFYFTCTLPVRISDINYGGHVGNDAMLSLLHEARLQYLNSYGYSEMDFAGNGLIMTDVAIEFKKEAYYGDMLLLSVTLADIQKWGFDLYYKIEKMCNDKKITVAIAKTGMLCYNYSLKKVVRLPKEVESTFSCLPPND